MHKKLMDAGYLEIKVIDEKNIYVPSEKGRQIGISLQTRKSAKEEYFVNVYNKNAEKIVRDLAKWGSVIYEATTDNKIGILSQGW